MRLYDFFEVILSKIIVKDLVDFLVRNQARKLINFEDVLNQVFEVLRYLFFCLHQFLVVLLCLTLFLIVKNLLVD